MLEVQIIFLKFLGQSILRLGVYRNFDTNNVGSNK